MPAYIKLSTLEYPRHEGDIRLEHPEITEDQTGETFPCPDTHALVADTLPPAFDWRTQSLVSLTPIQVNGAWVQAWGVRDLTAEELADIARAQFPKTPE